MPMQYPSSYRVPARLLLTVMSFLGLLLIGHRAYGQSASELAAQLRALRGQPGGSPGVVGDGKCGFIWSARLLQVARSVERAQAHELFSILQPAGTQTDTLIGHFRIHFDSSGVDAPALLDENLQRIPGTALAFADSVGRFFNKAWSVEIDQIGFDPPPLAAGAPWYDIYIKELGANYYGQTVPVDPPLNPGQPPLRYLSYIEIDNDFKDFYTKGMKGLKVTAAHEFGHAIQLGAYGFWENDVYAYELTSTWLEDAVFADVNDYYQYLKDFFVGFRNGRSFYDGTYGGYERCVWGIFLAKKFGIRTMSSVWKRMTQVPFLTATDAVLWEIGSGLADAFADFSYWNYFTADRADTARFYPDGQAYPRFTPAQQVTFNGATSSAVVTAYPLSLVMDDFAVPGDTITSVVANIDVPAALVRDAQGRTVILHLSSTVPAVPYQAFANGLRMGAEVPDPVHWRMEYLQRSVGSDAPRMMGDPFPNPLRLAADKDLFLPIQNPVGEAVEVLVLTSSMDRVLQGEYPVVARHGVNGVVLPASLLGGASSGVHFVTARASGKEYLWKVAVIR